MRKLFLALFISVSIFLFSCQKEISFGNGSGTGGGGGGTGGGSGSGGTTGTTLVKTVSKNGTDSVVTLYKYDANKKLINQTMTGMSQGIDQGNEYRYYRNAAGIITHYVQINPNFVMTGLDSVTTIVHYDAAASRYTSTVGEISLFGFTVTDSTVLVYDAAGKVIRTDVYQSIPFLGGYDLSLKTKYTYAANGNVAQLDMSSHDPVANTDNLIETIKYTYDAKTSALNVPVIFVSNSEAFAIGHGDWVSGNNATKVDIINVTDPTQNITVATTYTYNSTNRPATGVNTRTPGAIVDNIIYYYQ
jgi:hypothetical protein